jgi:hypothetical protein
MATVARVLGRASGQPPKPGGARRRREGLTAKARAERQWVLPCFVVGSVVSFVVVPVVKEVRSYGFI